jgi:hypothetical protein
MAERLGSVRAAAVVVSAHLFAIVVASIALGVFLTPTSRIHEVPPQPVRYAIYASAIFAMAGAAGTVVALFISRSTWFPLVYLWAVPFAIVLYPAIDPAAANFVYVGVTSHLAGPLAILASALWIAGIGAGLAMFLVTVRTYRSPRR